MRYNRFFSLLLALVMTSSTSPAWSLDDQAEAGAASTSAQDEKRDDAPRAPEEASSEEKTTEKAEADKQPLTGKDRPVRDKWALVVGISRFKSKKVPQLKFAAKDANDFYSYLIKEAGFAPDHVRILLNEDATERRILSELGNKFMARVANPDDLIVIFFSTHGSPSQLDLRGENYIVAYDTDPNDLYATGIDMKKILGAVDERVLSDRVLLVLDACHSGSVDPNAKGITRVGNFDAQSLAQGSGQMVICSSTPDQQSWESKRYKNGIFTRNLLASLRKDGTATPVVKAFSNMTRSVENEVRQDYPGMRQTPVLHSQWKGSNLILAVKPINRQKLPKEVTENLEPDSSPANIERRRSRMYTGTRVESNFKKPDELVLTRTYFSNVPDPKKAYTLACQAVASHFNMPDFYYKKALIQIQLKKYSSALQTLKPAIGINPQRHDYWLAKAYCFHKLGQEGRAQADLEQAKFRNPLLPKKITFGD